MTGPGFTAGAGLIPKDNMSEYIKGRQAPENDDTQAFNHMGIDPKAYPAWRHLQARLENDLTPCAGRLEWVSGNAADKATAAAGCSVCVAKASCAEYADAANERGATWGGVYRK